MQKKKSEQKSNMMPLGPDEFEKQSFMEECYFKCLSYRKYGANAMNIQYTSTDSTDGTSNFYPHRCSCVVRAEYFVNQVTIV